jgi:hypothetical protein
MTKKYFILLLVALSLTVGASAAIITVNSAGGADQTTLSAAITAAVADDTIRIIGVGPYDEIITVNKPLTIEGFGVRPNICVQLNGAGLDGFNVTGFSGTCVLKNLNIIPSLTTPPTDDGMFINPGAGQVMNLIMDGIVVCPNDGTNNPVTLNGLTEVDLTGKTPFGDDGITITSADATSVITAYMTNCVISHNQNGTNQDGMVIFPAVGSGSIVTIGPGCVISYNRRVAIQWGGAGADIRVQGAADNRVKIIGNYCNPATPGTYGGLYMFSGTADIDQCIFSANSGCGIVAASAVPTAPPSGLGLINVSNCIIANNGADGLRYNDTDPAHAVPVTVNKVTFFNNVQSPIDIYAANLTGNITITDCIFAGDGTEDITGTANAFLNDASPSVSTSFINFSGLVIAPGVSYTLATSSIDGVEGVGTTIVANSITADPLFASTDPANPNFLNVTNYAFSTAGSGGAPLAGGARYTGALLLNLAPIGTVNMTPGATKDFTASGGTNNFTWTLSNSTVGSINTTHGAIVSFSALSAGTVDLTVSDPGPPTQQLTVTITVVPTSAPIFIDAKDSKEVRFEIFE